MGEVTSAGVCIRIYIIRNPMNVYGLILALEC